MEGNTLFMSANEVVNFVKSFSLGRDSFKSGSSIFNDLISKLNTMKSNAITAEDNFYKNFIGVENLQQLQIRFDEAQKVLSGFSNRGIRAADWGKKVLNEGTSSTEILNALSNAIGKVVSDSNDFIEREYIIDKLAEKMAEYFNRDKDPGMRSVTKIVGGKTTNVLINKKALTNELIRVLGNEKKIEKISSTYSKDLKTFISKHLSIGEEGENEWKVSFEGIPTLQKFPREVPETVDGYPYFQLSPEDQQFALENNPVSNAVWEKFKTFLSNRRPEIEFCMETIGRKAFVISGDTFGQIAGILGELQAMSFLAIVTGQIPRYTGTELNYNSKQINIDVLFDTFGFQIKNYAEYGSGDSMGHHIKDSLSWSQLDDRFGGDSAFEQIKQFYVTQAYNYPVSKESELYENEDYKNFYANFFGSKSGSLNNSINAYIGGSLDKLIPLTTAVELFDLGNVNNNTVFWILSGKTIVPTSAICAALIDRLNNFVNQLSNNQKTTFQDFRVNTISSYTDKEQQWPAEVKYEDVLTKLSGLKYDFNIYLQDFQQYLDRSSIIFTS